MLLNRYKEEITPKKKSADVEVYRIDALTKHKMAALPLSNLHSHVIASYRDERLKTVTAGTVLKELSLLGHAIDIGMKEWAVYLPSNPVKNIRRPSAPRARDRRFYGDEEKRLLAELKTKTRNDLVHSVVVIAVETAMRRGEILGLEWTDVDLDKRTVHLSDTKNGEARDIPLSKKATKVLLALRSVSADECFVFPLTPNALKKSFGRAVDRAKIDGFRFHDLRHEGTSRLFEKGLNIMEVATITGHKDLSMLRRYTHLKAVDLVKKLD